MKPRLSWCQETRCEGVARCRACRTIYQRGWRARKKPERLKGPNHKKATTPPFPPKGEVPKIPGMKTAADMLTSGWEPVKKERKTNLVSPTAEVLPKQCPVCAGDLVQGRGYGGKLVWACPGRRT